MLTVNNHPVPEAESCPPSDPDMTDRPRKHLTDSRAWELIRRKSGCENAAEFQRLERDKRDAVLSKALKEGVSIRQASRLTGISIGVIRKLSNS